MKRISNFRCRLLERWFDCLAFAANFRFPRWVPNPRPTDCTVQGQLFKTNRRATSLNRRLPNSPKMINIPVLPDKSCKSCRTSCDSLRTAHNGSAWLCTQSRASQSLDTRAGMQGNFAQFSLFLVGFVFFWRDLLPSLRKYLVI